ncbi:MAG: ATP-dependent protease subunit HslV [Deltaproteobacteria bacterium]|nr:ATP-dependent protease subunit HslV [Deltaproteobacteria bacterium]
MSTRIHRRGAEHELTLRPEIRSTTILALRHKGVTVMAGDGQVTMNGTIVKGTARKVRRSAEGRIVAGFAGSAADGMTLFDRFEAKLKEYGGNLTRAAVELAKDWRTDRLLRRLEALMIVADRERIFLLSGTGDVIEPDGGVVGIGSGGSYATSAARALVRHTELDARSIAESAMTIAAEICVYTNRELVIEELS